MNRVLLGCVTFACWATLPASAEIVRPVRPQPVLPPVTAPVEAPSSAAPTQTEVADETLAAPPKAQADNIRRPPAEPVAASPAVASPVEGDMTGPDPARGNIRWPAKAATVAPAQDAAPAPPPVEGADVPPAVSRVDAFREALAAYAQGQHAQAAELFRAAAEAGDVRASAALGYLQAKGMGVPRDPLRGRRQLEAASAAGLARADYLLSVLERDDRRAGAAQREASYRERAARRDDALAQNAMGVHYQRQGDPTTAELWYARAADAGSASARRNLASMAPGTAPDGAVGETPATPQTDSLYAQARRYHRGEGVPVDYGQALRYYRAAAARGSEPARQMLGLIQSRPSRDGAVDPAWMRQLASAPVAGTGGVATPAASTPARTAPRLDDPLSGLAALSPGQAASPKATTARRTP